MTLRLQLYCYLVLMHGFPVAMAVHFFRADNLPAFFLMEALLLLTIPAGVRLAGKMLRPVELIREGKAAFEGREFGSRLKPCGVRELDEVVALFNGLLEELYREQMKLGERKGFFDKLLRATPIGLLIYDFDGLVSNLNPAAEEMLDESAENLLGQPLTTCASPLGRAIVEHAKLPALISLPDGKQYRVQKSDFFDRGFRRGFLMLEELTSEMQAAERQAYEKLIRMTSHEVNNTIGATNSLLEGCGDYRSQLREEDREDFSRALDIVTARNSRLGAFMKRLAQVVHIPAPDHQAADLRTLLENIQGMFSRELRERNILWQADVEAVPPVQLDPNLFEQALINVVKNAYEAIGREGVLRVSVKFREGGVVLSVEDSAGALTPDDKRKLFKPFHTTKREGQGVGLMLVREILKQHGFAYQLDCRPGEWTRFSIVIPASAVAAISREGAGASTNSAGGCGSDP